ncbi:MAG: PE-PPE domain-containing protein [Mycobacterium sp.]
MMTRLASVAVAVTMLFGMSQASAHAEIDYGAGSGARVAALPGAFSSPQATMRQLQGRPCAPPNVCEPVTFANYGSFLGGNMGLLSLNDGVAKLDHWIRTTPGRKIAFGASLGASVVYKWLRLYSADATAPPPSELSFITDGAPERRGTGYVYSDPKGMYDYRKQEGFGIPAGTPYRVVDVCRKWDGWCYWIPGDQRSENGMNQLHIDYSQIDVNDPANEVVVEGNVTYVLVPTPGWG